MFQEPNTINECFTVEEKVPHVNTASANNMDTKMMSKYKNYIAASGTSAVSIANIDSNSTDKIDELLEKEKQNMSSEPWNKLDKRLKIQKLHAYAEKYGKENSLPLKEVKSLTGEKEAERPERSEEMESEKEEEEAEQRASR